MLSGATTTDQGVEEISMPLLKIEYREINRQSKDLADDKKKQI